MHRKLGNFILVAAFGLLAVQHGHATAEENPIVRENRQLGTRDWILRNPKVPGAKRYFEDAGLM